MRYATFVNFTEKPFTAYWNGRPYTFKPAQKSEHLNEMIAQHFAKHLANQVLTDAGKEQYCSPKKPTDVPQFMDVFNKAFFIEGNGSEVDSETGLPTDAVGQPDQPGMNVRVTQRVTADPYDARANADAALPAGAPQIIGSATEGSDDVGDEEASFEGTGE
jgi:hypothetical protein